MRPEIRFAAAAAAFAFALPLAQAGPSAVARASTDLAGFATLHGCPFCHREAPAPREQAGLPLAPSWQEIAERYRNDPAAPERLSRIVMEGADPAHPRWKERVDFNAMRASEQSLRAEDANALVRWILARPAAKGAL